MDLKDVGMIVAEQMDALEESDYPEGTTIPAALTAVVVRLPDGNGSVRCRISLPTIEEDLLLSENYRHEVSSLLIKGILQQAIIQDWL